MWHVLLSLCLNTAVAACLMLKENRCDKWSAGVPVMEEEKEGDFEWVISNPVSRNHFTETFPPIASHHSDISPDQEGGTNCIFSLRPC